MQDRLLSVSPTDGTLLSEFPIATASEIEAALTHAQATYNSWRKWTFEQRAALLQDIAALLREKKEALALLAANEMGKPIKQGREEVEKCASTLQYYATEAAKMLATEIVITDATKSYITYKPLGVILAIMPWNFPYWQVLRAFAPIVMGGNVMLLKHASNVSGCALAMEQIIKEAGAPLGLFQTLIIPSSAIEKIIEHPAIAGVTLTGSTTAGRKVAEVAGRNLKKQVLELGGSDAYVIMEDADIDAAAEICVNGRLKNSGQSCVAAKRFVVPMPILEAFKQAVTTKMQAITWGDPLNEDNFIGPLARTDLRNQLHEQVVNSCKMGAELLCGGYLPEGEGAYYPPTVLAGVKKGMPAYEEELFGPVAAIIAAKDLHEAIAIANDSEYGLGAAIIGKDIALAEKVAAEELEAGNCFVNDFVHSDARLPFGGVKNSGYGRELGAFGIREFVNIKTVYIK